MTDRTEAFSFPVRCFEKNDKGSAPYRFVPLYELDFETASAPCVGDVLIGESHNYIVTSRQFEVLEKTSRIARCALLVEKTDTEIIEG